MATPSKLKSKMQLLEELGPLSSGGLIAGSGTGAGQAFTGQASGTDFVNSDKLIEANKGKGQAMTEAALSGQVDETGDFSDLNALNSYDPSTGLNTTVGETKVASREVERTDDQGNVFKDFFTDTTTGPTTTTYTGWSDSDLNAKAEKIRGLKSQFEDFDKALGDNPDAADARASLLNDKNKKNISTYSAGQNAFDSFLSEGEGQGAIRSKADKVKDLAKNFDGLDKKVADVRQGIVGATSKVGVVDGKTTTDMRSEMVRAAPPKTTVSNLEPNGLVDAVGTTGAGLDPTIEDIARGLSAKNISGAVNDTLQNIGNAAIVTPVGQAGNAVKDAADTLIGDPTKATVNTVKNAANKVKKWKW